MFSPDQMATKVEKITDSRMGSEKSLCQPNRLESPHPSFPHPGRLMRLLHPIILIPFSTVDHIRHQFSMGDWITAKFVRHDLSGFTTMATQQPLEEPLSCSTIPFRLQIDIHHLPVLIDSPPQIMLFAIYLYEDFIEVKSVTVTSVLAFQSACINGSELDTPVTDRFSGYSDASLGQ